MVLGNEIADWLAECGTTGHSVTMTQWIDQWAAARREHERRRPPRVRATARAHPPTPSRGDG